jgi:integrase/recombinase XerD
MNNSLNKMKFDMELKGFADKTITVYLRNVIKVSKHFNLPPEELTKEQIREFLHYSIKVRKLSRSYVNSVYSAIYFYFRNTLKQEWNMIDIPRVKQPSKLPVALSHFQVQLLFKAVSNIKHKTMLITCYSAGLRVSELLDLKVSDINSKTMTIRVRSGKGGKERYTLLSKTNLIALRKYYTIFKPTDYLFFNPNTLKPLSTRTIQTTYSTYRDSLNLPKDSTLHSLRHSFATHLILSGVNIVVIQKLLGHSDIGTTSKYLHLTNAEATNVISPLDNMEVFYD